MPIATILGYLDFRFYVIPILQRLSHSTRAYIVNADGLPGFFTLDIFNILKNADEKGQLKYARKSKAFDIIELKDELNTKNSNELKMEHLRQSYPSLYVHVLRHFRMSDKLDKYLS